MSDKLTKLTQLSQNEINFAFSSTINELQSILKNSKNNNTNLNNNNNNNNNITTNNNNNNNNNNLQHNSETNKLIDELFVALDEEKRQNETLDKENKKLRKMYQELQNDKYDKLLNSETSEDIIRNINRSRRISKRISPITESLNKNRRIPSSITNMNDSNIILMETNSINQEELNKETNQNEYQNNIDINDVINNPKNWLLNGDNEIIIYDESERLNKQEKLENFVKNGNTTNINNNNNNDEEKMDYIEIIHENTPQIPQNIQNNNHQTQNNFKNTVEIDINNRKSYNHMPMPPERSSTKKNIESNLILISKKEIIESKESHDSKTDPVLNTISNKHIIEEKNEQKIINKQNNKNNNQKIDIPLDNTKYNDPNIITNNINTIRSPDELLQSHKHPILKDGTVKENIQNVITPQKDKQTSGGLFSWFG